MFNRSKSGNKEKRTGTTSFFSFRSRKPTSVEVPAHTKEQETVETKQVAPSYAFADSQKGEKDTETEKRGKEVDEKIREAKGKREDDQEGPVTRFTPPSKKVVDNEPEDRAHTTMVVTAPAVFNRYWKLVTTYDLEDVVESSINFWIPNAIAMFAILNESGRYARDNRFMVKHHPEYLDYAVACYYSMIFYIQILRAQEAAGQLDGHDLTFLKRFRNQFKLEELPISSIMEPFFSNIVSYLPADSKYEWIVPDYGKDLLYVDAAASPRVGLELRTANFTAKQGTYLIQPMVPYMLAILRKAISGASIDNAANAGANFDNQDRYLPHAIPGAAAAAGVNIFNNVIQSGNGHEAERNCFLHGCGVRYPFYADLQSLQLARPKWRRSTFWNFRYTLTQPANQERTHRGRPVTNNKAIGSIEQFLCMEKGEDVSWFNELINQAALHARFFDRVVSLSDIPTTGGAGTTVIARMFDRWIDDEGNVSTTDRTPDLGASQAEQSRDDFITWYPSTFSEFRASFTTNREKVEREETLQAISFATNAEFSVVHATNNHRLGGRNTSFRTGAFWDNEQWVSELRHNAGADNGIKMFEGWSTMYQEDAAVVKPQGY